MLMNLVICEDNPFHSKLLIDLLFKWADTKNIDLKYEVFETTHSTEQYILNNKNIDILFLDVFLKNDNRTGITLATSLRKSNITTPIILTTCDKSKAADGYLFDAIGFLLKPIDYNKLILFIEKAMRKKQEDSKYIEIVSNGNRTIIHQKDIIYVESRFRKVIFYTSKERFNINITLKDAISMLDEKIFFKIYYSYVISLRNVICIKTTRPHTVTLSKDDKQIELPVSRELVKELIQLYSTYMKD